MWLARALGIMTFVAVYLALLASSAVAQSLTGTVSVGDNPGATIADPMRNLIYVICDYDDTFYVIDGNSNAVVRTIPLPYNISGAALDPVANRLYVASCSPIHVLDASTLSSATPTLSPTPTQTATPGPSPTPTRTRTPGAAQILLPLIRKGFPPPPPTPTPTPTPEWQGRPNDGSWRGQTTTDGHPDHTQTISFETAKGGSEIRAGMDLVTYVYESNFWTCSGTATWEIASAIPVGIDGAFEFSRTYIGGNISGSGRFISPTRAEGTYATNVLYGVCGNIYNTGTWWATWQGAGSPEAAGVTGQVVQ